MTQSASFVCKNEGKNQELYVIKTKISSGIFSDCLMTRSERATRVDERKECTRVNEWSRKNSSIADACCESLIPNVSCWMWGKNQSFGGKNHHHNLYVCMHYFSKLLLSERVQVAGTHLSMQINQDQVHRWDSFFAVIGKEVKRLELTFSLLWSFRRESSEGSLES